MINLKDYSLYLLGKRDYGVKELETKLKLKGYDKDQISDLIKVYIEIGILNDNSLIERRIAYLVTKNKSRKQIEIFLLNKGFDKDLVKSSLSKYDFESVEDDILTKHIMKYLRASTPIPKDKIIRRLQGKGFSYKSIIKIIDKHVE